MLRRTVTAAQPTRTTVKLRFATPGSRQRYKRGQEADNDQKRTTQSLHTAYVNKSSYHSQPPTGSEHGRRFRPTPPTSHPLSDTGPCTGRLAHLMSAIEVYSACRITADATSQPELDHLAIARLKYSVLNYHHVVHRV